MGGKPVHATEREEEGEMNLSTNKNLPLSEQYHEGGIKTRIS